MRRLGSRLLITQISISFIVSFVLGISTLSLARAYFIDSLESALDTQATLISEALFPEELSLAEVNQEDAAFNAVQQQIGNLSVEIQGLKADPTTSSLLIEDLSPQVEAFESIELAVAFIRADGTPLLQPDREDLPAPFTKIGSLEKAMQENSKATVTRSTGTSWLVKSYPVVRREIPQGILTLGQPLDALEAVLVNLGWRVAAAALVALGIASVISILTARGLIAPITALMRASRSLPYGLYDDPLPIDRQDELGELSRTFEEMRSKLEALEKLRSQFVSDVSHELRTPLTAIKGLAETLQDGAVEDVEVRDRFLASIEQETDRLIRLTHDLLTLTRIDGESLNLQREPCDLHMILEKTLLALNAEIRAKGLQVTILSRWERIPLLADEDRVVQILLNLLDNAIQHSPASSVIEVKLDIGSIIDPHVKAILTLPQPYGGTRPHLDDLKAGSAWAFLQIKDLGAGIQPADLAQVFERFYRADTARSRSIGGAGLGLSIAQALAQAHAGYLWLHSPAASDTKATQNGTTAILMLPATD
jgi:signal transduction histidine kinase